MNESTVFWTVCYGVDILMSESPADRSTGDLQPNKSEGTLYCAGCNERFFAVKTPGVCPRCGAGVTSTSTTSLAETVMLTDSTSDGGETPVHVSQPSTRRSALEAAQSDPLVGKALHVYHCESLLGCGGMGRVYLARHVQLHRKCALKVLAPRVSSNDLDFIIRFQQEGRATAALVHPNIVTIHAIGEADGHHFLEMEFIRGRTLQQLVDTEGRLTPIRATALTTQVAQGLAAAHREGIIHRDLKLDNVLLTEQGIPKLADFGLAKRVRKSGKEVGEVLAGTPNYMAPELFQGQGATTASDVYALGVCYFVLLTGGLPFVGNSLNDLMAKVTQDPIPNIRDQFPDISLEMAECLGLLLAKSPANRPSSGIEAAQLLHAIWGQVRDIESLLKDAFLDYGGVSWTRQDGRYEIQLEFPDGRGQKVFMENSEHGATERLLLIYSLCCEAQPEYYEDALRLNAEMAHGGLAIRNFEGQDMFCVVDTFPRASVDALDVRRSVLEVGYRADSVEKLLTGKDVH